MITSIVFFIAGYVAWGMIQEAMALQYRAAKKDKDKR